MLIYVLYFILANIVAFSIYLYNKKHDIVKISESKIKIILVFFTFGIFAILLALRHPSMGLDLQYGKPGGYLGLVEYTGSFSLAMILFGNVPIAFERGYLLLSWIISKISLNYQFYLIVVSLISICPIGYVVYKKSKNIYLSWVVYMFLPVCILPFSGIRQSIAISIAFCSILFVEQKKIKEFILTIILAALFHETALICLMYYPLYHISLSKQVKCFLLAIPAIVFIFGKEIVYLLSTIIPSIDVSFTNSWEMFLVFYILLIVSFIITNKSRNLKCIGYSNIFYFAVIFQALSNYFIQFGRIAYYFSIFSILIVPLLYQFKFKSNLTKVVVLLFIMLIQIISLLFLSRDGWQMSNPYLFFWQ